MKEKYYTVDTTPVNTNIEAQSGGGIIINDPNMKLSIDYRILKPGKIQITIDCHTPQPDKEDIENNSHEE